MWPPPNPACPPPAWPAPCWAATGIEASNRTNVAMVKGRRIGSLYADSESEFVKFRDGRNRSQPLRTRGTWRNSKASTTGDTGYGCVSHAPYFWLQTLQWARFGEDWAISFSLSGLFSALAWGQASTLASRRVSRAWVRALRVLL